MCGLTFSLTCCDSDSPTTSPAVLSSLRESASHRGPNTSGTFAALVPISSSAYARLSLSAAVLGLRGQLTPQPLVSASGVLGYNGQVYSGLDLRAHANNDTRAIYARLQRGDPVREVMDSVEGPIVYFGVDPFSRRSLLLHHSAAGFVLASTRSSVAREAGLSMCALDGGQHGELRLDLVTEGPGGLDFSKALLLLQTSSNAIGPVNAVDKASFDDGEVRQFLLQLEASVRRRVENVPAMSTTSPRIAILFSGGVDCTLLACLVHQVLPAGEAVELVNVAFASPTAAVPSYSTPDRQSALDAVAELRALYPSRQWVFVAVDVPADVAAAHRQAVVDVMYPANSEMDLSLAYPLYFASRGIGHIHGPGAQQDYAVQAKVYISGLGADEQLGGYGRHRKAAERGGHSALLDEINLDLARLPTRNLSRDDRVLSHAARDARYPYLDLAFVAYLSSLPLGAKCDFTRPPGDGDKRLLREAARMCGLRDTAARVKRAMQFGTRSAKLGGGIKRGESASLVAIAD